MLVAEDHGPLAQFIAATLSAAGWTICSLVGDVDGALAAARLSPLELAVIDRSLGGEDSWAVADALAARNIPYLLVSGYPRSTLPDRFRAGAYLEKPFTMEQLLDAVRRLFRDKC